MDPRYDFSYFLSWLPTSKHVMKVVSQLELSNVDSFKNSISNLVVHQISWRFLTFNTNIEETLWSQSAIFSEYFKKLRLDHASKSWSVAFLYARKGASPKHSSCRKNKRSITSNTHLIELDNIRLYQWEGSINERIFQL